MATKTQDPDFFDGLRALLGSAVATVVAVFALFNSVFAELVPPIPSKATTVGWISLGALVVLLALSAILLQLKGRTVLLVSSTLSVLFLGAAFAMYLPYTAELRTYVFQIPPPPAAANERHVRGDLHKEGLARLGGRSIDKFASADPDGVLNTDVLWTVKSRNEVSARLEGWYVGISMLMISAIFLSLISLWLLVSKRPWPA